VRARPISLLVFSHTVVDASQNILPVLLPLLQARFGLSYTRVGAAAAMLTISSSVIQPLFGWVADRWNTQWFLPAGIVWTGLLMGLVGLVPNYWILVLALTLAGLGTAAFHPVASMAAAHVSGSQRGLGMSFFSAGGNLGFAVGPILIAWVLPWLGLKGTVSLLVPCVLMGGAIHWCRRDIEVPYLGPRKRSTLAGGPIPWAKLSVLCLLITLRSWGYSGLIIFLPMYLLDQGLPLALTGTALFVFLFFGALGGMVGGHLSDRIGRLQVIAASLLGYPVVMAGALGFSGWLRWVFLALAGMMLLASFSVTVVFAQELLPQHVGLASGLTFGMAFGTGGLGVAVSGVMADLLGLSASVWLLVFLPPIAGVLALRLKSPRHGSVMPERTQHAPTGD